VVLSADLGARLEVYYKLLASWNAKMNLTGLDLTEQDPAAIDRLLVEPLVAARHAPPITRMIDIGSGGGSPATPLALALSASRVLLVEAKTRKSVFLREALRALEMNSSEVITARYEELLARPELHEAHDLLTIRAVRVEPRILMNLQAFVRPSGEMFLFRSGANSRPSLPTPPLAFRVAFPLLDSQGSSLLVLEKRPVGVSRP